MARKNSIAEDKKTGIKISKNDASYRRLPLLIQQLIDLDFPLEADLIHGEYRVLYFYKSDELIIKEDSKIAEKMLAFDKNGAKGVVTDPEQIILWNYEWYLASKLKNSTYPELNPFWEKKFLAKKWLSRVYTYTPNIEQFEKDKENIDLEREISLEEMTQNETKALNVSTVTEDTSDQSDDFNL